MRISDWSSDLCSSDLPRKRIVFTLRHILPDKRAAHERGYWRLRIQSDMGRAGAFRQVLFDGHIRWLAACRGHHLSQIRQTAWVRRGCCWSIQQAWNDNGYSQSVPLHAFHSSCFPDTFYTTPSEQAPIAPH